ncbi:Uncharacterized protein SCG7086_BU_00070 [Chlamydiales bacterium SCGC AG-110-P3]|nr:Uncharacterized protein SCG7086_BU_00070 [Chlamydiales bacterium SCGC AG-110-P3]
MKIALKGHGQLLIISLLITLTTSSWLSTASAEIISEASAGYVTVEDQNALRVLTPSLADRETAKIRLDNGLEAYLISDPSADKSAAALSVNVGSWSDPVDAPGLAHFCEHMLFLGTKKYPNESEYHRFVSEHGGLANAYTTNDHTSYMFAINNDALIEALDRFSNFFKEPLFNPSGVDRELQAIEGEFATHLDKDVTRKIQVYKQLANPMHPYSRFTIGNLKSLEGVSQDTLKDWYYEHYSSDIMHLVVYSPLPIERLTALVTKGFGGIVKRNRQPLHVDTPVRSEASKNSIVYIAPIKDTRTLSLTWELGAPYNRRLDTKPSDLTAFVLGHEGSESLLAQLKRENLAEGLAAGGYELSDTSLLFGIDVQLTEPGIRKIDTVIERCFQAISRIQQEGIPEYIFAEEQKMDTLRYQYQERTDAFSTVSDHARSMLYEPLETYPQFSLVSEKFDPQLVSAFINELTPDSCDVAVIAPPKFTKLNLNKTEPWLGTAYSVVPIADNRLATWKAAQSHIDIRLPAPNPYVPTSLALVDAPSPAPASDGIIVKPTAVIDDPDYGLVYFATDDRYKVPEVHWMLTLRTPAIHRDEAKELVLTDIYVRAVAEELNNLSYNALLAGLHFEIARIDEQISITVSGYSENAKQLLDQIFKTLKTVHPTKEQFNTYKRSIKRSYANFDKESPISLGAELLKTVVHKDFVAARLKAKAAGAIQYGDFIAFANEVLQKAYLEAMLYGNMTDADAKELWDSYRTTIASRGYARDRHQTPKVVVLPKDKGPYYLERKTSQNGNAVILALQNGPYSFISRAAQQTLGTVINEPFFSELRTKQQTGYIVYSTTQEIEKQIFSFFAAQSATHSNRDLLSRFEQFIEEFLEEMDTDPQGLERFNTVKSALTTELAQPPRNQETMAGILATLAFKHDGDFDFLSKRIQGFQQLTYERYLELAEEFLGKQNQQRLAIFVKGKMPESTVLDYRRIKSADQLKSVSTYATAKENTEPQ